MTEYGMLFYLTTKQIVFAASVFLKGGQEPGVEVREVELSTECWVMGRYYYAALYLGQNMEEDWVEFGSGVPQRSPPHVTPGKRLRSS